MSERPPPKPRAPRFAKKSLGQNFLVDAGAIAKIVNAIPEDTELLLEIGPGRGALSTELFRRARKFCVLEKDDLFAEKIEGTLFIHGSRQHHVFHADALEFDWERIWTETESPPSTPLVVAANLPYNVATEILFHLLARRHRIPLMVLMFQKEVGVRIAARSGSRDYGILSVAAQNGYDVRVQQVLKPGAFRPSPKVDSAVLEFRRREAPLVSFPDYAEERRFLDLVRIAFAHRRKTLENSLSMELHRLPWLKVAGKAALQERLRLADIEGGRRPETLSPEDYGRLYRALTENPA
jgi:16S rRNA (adenine1518-N6/adenine1519-N6)-dimethyltransferase